MKQRTDIYFSKEYCELCALAEEGEVTEFKYNSELGEVTYLFLKRPINVNDEFSGYYDIVSPYGYGGPVIRELSDETDDGKKKLVSGYIKEFNQYCVDNNIVSEFVRFHPIIGNALDFGEALDVTYNRHTVGTNIEAYEDPVASECTKSCRKRIRQALNKGITYKVTYRPESLDCFKEIYYATMDRNEASDYYYFHDEYFDTCLKTMKDKLLTVEAIYVDPENPENGEQIIAMNLCFIDGDYAHIHLSGTRDEFLHLSPAYILRYALIEWCKENGVKMIHHGGGRSSSEEDSLYQFKKQFGQNTSFDFYLGRKILLPDVYNDLCNKMNKPTESDYFPAYRA